ncbi:hypothetical protein C5S39_02985 [Candidatus Methanophagaceae archaeon]|jgi:hypothetical protein|nr:hypothetical protein C5S39_02985 [Methanophagales archaeon]
MRVITLNAEITKDINARRHRTLFRYLLAWVLSLATYIFRSVLYLKPENIAKIAVNANE